MYATIQHYQATPPITEEIVHSARQVAASLSQFPGIVSFLILKTQSDVLVSVSIFEDRVGLADADRLVARMMAEHLGTPLPGYREVTTGEVVLQRGL